MFHLYSVDSLNNEIPGNSVYGKSRRRDAQLCIPTKGNNQRRYEFINKGTLRNMFIMLFVSFSSPVFAHEGFNVVLNDVVVNLYTVTVLEDTHIAENQTQMNMMIQVAYGRGAAPADTKVFLTLGQDQKIIYDSEVKYVASSSSDGRTFYAYYIVTIPLPQQGLHQVTLELTGSLGKATKSFQFEAKAAPDFRAVELIPSFLIISICLAGLALFFFSSRVPLQTTATQKDQKGLHHA